MAIGSERDDRPAGPAGGRGRTGAIESPEEVGSRLEEITHRGDGTGSDAPWRSVVASRRAARRSEVVDAEAAGEPTGIDPESGVADAAGVRRFSAVFAGGRRWAVGLSWSAGDVSINDHRREAVRYGRQLAATGGEGICDLAVFRPLRSGPWYQLGLGRSSHGVREREPSLAAMLADRFAGEATLALFEIEEGVLYFIAVDAEGVVRPGTDVCTDDLDWVLKEFFELRRAAPQWRALVPGELLPDVPEADPVVLADLLRGPVGPELEWLRFPYRGALRRLAVAAVAVAVVAALGWGWRDYLLERAEVAQRIAREQAEHARRFSEEVKAKVIDPVVPAPWEDTGLRIVSPERFIGECTRGIRSVPVRSWSLHRAAREGRAPPGSYGAYDVKVVRCDGGGLEVVLGSVVSSSDEARSPAERLERRRFEMVEDSGFAYAPVLLKKVEGSEERAGRDGYLDQFEAVMSMLGRHAGRLRGAEFLAGARSVGRQERSERTAWISQRFSLRMRASPHDDPGWLAQLEALPGVQIDAVSYAAGARPDRRRWFIEGWVGAMAPILAEIRGS